MSPMLKTILEMTAEQENVHPAFRQGVRLAGLEDAIMLAKPDFCEAAESILAPMMAVLERRYDRPWTKSYQDMGDVKDAYEKLFKALMAADDAEES